MNIALLTAGGVGNRMGQDIPKQFMTIDNIPVIIYTMRAFQQHPQIDALAVVCLKGWEVMLQAYANQFNITKLQWIFEGGDSNQHSIRNGLQGLRDAGCKDDDIVLVHDGVTFTPASMASIMYDREAHSTSRASLWRGTMSLTSTPAKAAVRMAKSTGSVGRK